MRTALSLIFLFSTLLLAGCGKSFTPANAPTTNTSESIPSEEPPVTSTPATPDPDDEGLKICSKLNFSQVVWSSQLSALDQSAFQIALNASGSFEGNTGWANLTNNFDGQGLSMGLLNQTLGTGSLQPLWIKMKTLNYNSMQGLFTATHFQSVSDMLQAYGSKAQLSAVGGNFQQNSSPLDKNWSAPVETFAVSKEAASVQWAVKNLYNGTSFKSDWSKELSALANHPLYVSLQIEAAEAIHNKARTLQTTLGLHDLRSYLVLFDFVVQNGGLDSHEIPEYLAAVQKNPSMTIQQKLTTILELRLRRVKPEYVADVRSRKTALIMGSGTVHGAKRQLEKEYCYSGTFPY